VQIGISYADSYKLLRTTAKLKFAGLINAKATAVARTLPWALSVNTKRH
jgi:hypothetical protein